MFKNVVNNPTLAGFTLNRVHTDKANNQRPVEYPDGWEQVSWQMNPNDPDEVPASFHRDEGYGLAAGFMKWEGGYVQRGVSLRKGQRYLAKAVFFVNMSFHQNPPPADGMTHIQWRFLFNDGGHQIESAWTSSTQGRFGVQEEFLFVVESVRDAPMDFGFVLRSTWPSTAGEIHIKSIELMEVPADYGTPVAIGNPGASASAPAAAPPPKTAEAAKPAASAETVKNPAVQVDAETAKTLDEVITNDDITVISAGFRAAAQGGQFPPDVAAGFTRFADVLDRLRK